MKCSVVHMLGVVLDTKTAATTTTTLFVYLPTNLLNLNDILLF